MISNDSEDEVRLKQEIHFKTASRICRQILPHLYNVYGFSELDLINETVKYCFIFGLSNRHTEELRKELKYLIGYRLGL